MATGRASSSSVPAIMAVCVTNLLRAAPDPAEEPLSAVSFVQSPGLLEVEFRSAERPLPICPSHKGASERKRQLKCKVPEGVAFFVHRKERRDPRATPTDLGWRVGAIGPDRARRAGRAR